MVAHTEGVKPRAEGVKPRANAPNQDGTDTQVEMVAKDVVVALELLEVEKPAPTEDQGVSIELSSMPLEPHAIIFYFAFTLLYSFLLVFCNLALKN